MLNRRETHFQIKYPSDFKLRYQKHQIVVLFVNFELFNSMADLTAEDCRRSILRNRFQLGQSWLACSKGVSRC